MFNGYCFDIESNGFYFEADKVWTVSLRDLDNPEKTLKLNPFKDSTFFSKWTDWHDNYENPLVIGHYILGYDLFVVFKLLGVDFTVGKDTMFGKPCIFVDTLYLSQYMNPDLNGHSLEDWGLRVGFEKIDYFQVAKDKGIIPKDAKKGDEFSVHSEDMDIYCERDTAVNVKMFTQLWTEFCAIYGVVSNNIPNHFKCGQKSFFLMSCQEYTGWKFDQDLGADLQVRIKLMMDEVEKEVLPQLPPRKLKKGEEKEYTMPAKPFKKNGDLSSHMLNFIEKHNGILKENNLIEFYGEVYAIESQKMLNMTLPMEIKDGDDLKGWFMRGWIKEEFKDLYGDVEWINE